MPTSEYAPALKAALETLSYFRRQAAAQEDRSRELLAKAEKSGYDPITLRGPEVGSVCILMHLAERMKRELEDLERAVDASVARLDGG